MDFVPFMKEPLQPRDKSHVNIFILPQTKPIFGIQNTSCCGITNTAVTLLPNLKEILNSKEDASEPLLNISYLEQLGIQDWITPSYSYNFFMPKSFGLNPTLLCKTNENYYMGPNNACDKQMQLISCSVFLSISMLPAVNLLRLWVHSFAWEKLLLGTVQSGRGRAAWNQSPHQAGGMAS